MRHFILHETARQVIVVNLHETPYKDWPEPAKKEARRIISNPSSERKIRNDLFPRTKLVELVCAFQQWDNEVMRELQQEVHDQHNEKY